MNITKYQVEMLNVEDADAFIVYYYTDDGQSHLVLIDAGRYADGALVLERLNQYYSGVSVELAIVTHPDDDHYGGFIYMLQRLNEKDKNAVKIQNFWINDPRKHIVVDDVKEEIQRKTLEKRLAEIYQAEGISLLSLIAEMKIPYEEAFAEITSSFDYDYNGHFRLKKSVKSSSQFGFTILGPTKEYYEQICKGFRYDHLHVSEIDENDDIVDLDDFKKTDTCLSKVLDDTIDDTSDHNKSSVIVLFAPNETTKYLFTGDACVESFENMLKPHKNICKSVSWMKVPHHGSAHNLNSAWILHFKSKIAYISTKRIGKFLNQCVINALKNGGAKVYCSHKNIGGLLDNSFQNRRGWSSDCVVES